MARDGGPRQGRSRRVGIKELPARPDDAFQQAVTEVLKKNAGILDLPALAQPRMTFGGDDLYPMLGEKAAALRYSLSKNHPCVDGNKRTGHAEEMTRGEFTNLSDLSHCLTDLL